MISRKEIKYKGAIPVKSIFSITENGKLLLKRPVRYFSSFAKGGGNPKTSLKNRKCSNRVSQPK